MAGIRFTKTRLRPDEKRRLIDYIENVMAIDPSIVDETRLFKTCFDEICLIYEDSIPDTATTTVYKGRWVAGIIGDTLFLSPWLYSEIYSNIGYRAAIVITKKAVEIFLYGGDIYASSIVKFYEPIDNIVAVIDPRDSTVIGVAQPLVKGGELRSAIKEKRSEPVFKNIFDLGLFLRKLG